MKNILARAFGVWVPIAVVITGVFAFGYWAVQQNYRQSLNDPQIQMAEDAAVYLANDYTPAALVPRGVSPVDIATSLAPWIAVYDASGTPLESGAVLDGSPPRLPTGVFDTSTWRKFIIGHHLNTAPQNEDRFSWQPRADVRQAIVLVSFNAPHGIGFVAAGRNMREVEAREAALAGGATALWGMTMLASLVAIVVLIALGWL